VETATATTFSLYKDGSPVKKPGYAESIESPYRSYTPKATLGEKQFFLPSSQREFYELQLS
jgi:hypothetical protein